MATVGTIVKFLQQLNPKLPMKVVWELTDHEVEPEFFVVTTGRGGASLDLDAEGGCGFANDLTPEARIPPEYLKKKVV